MEMYVLVSVVERRINTLFFKDYEDAQYEMRKQYNAIVFNGGHDYIIGDSYAYCEYCGQNYDWEIFDYED